MSTVPDRAPEFVTYDYAHIVQGTPPYRHSSQSKACQRARWASHRDECKWYSEVRQDVAVETKGPQAWKDLCAWVEFHRTSLVNCAVASFNLVKNPGSQKYTTFCVDIHYCNEPGQRMEQRFCLKDMGATDMRNPDNEVPGFNPETVAGGRAVMEAGKKRYGEDYAGTGMICLTADFNTMIVDFPPIMFTIDKTVARAERRPGWNAFLHDYVRQGKKMRFCCRKSEGGCCCGPRARARDADNQACPFSRCLLF
ncbi:hypothetical protein EWM64_g3324 [Hericium alpestre]|uniref:MYND-type domain-containing protein n=1 Tax=Hericium alpestre TaxID=135208 RepID=A0A4Z0A4S9_9AGAM|nr:hypothetical protein EWM64_g3324 [Hericium alpestre]